jgi:hypothetical protein
VGVKVIDCVLVPVEGVVELLVQAKLPLTEAAPVSGPP